MWAPLFFASGEWKCQTGPERRFGAVQHRQQRWPERRVELHPGRGALRLDTETLWLAINVLNLLTLDWSFLCNSGDAVAWWATTTGTRPCMRTWCQTAAASSSTRAVAATPPTPSGRGSVCVACRVVKQFYFSRFALTFCLDSRRPALLALV